MRNLFDDLPLKLSREITEILTEGKFARIERIASFGQSSPEGFWYDQEQSEWIVVLKGEAKFLIESDKEPIHLRVGDHLLIPARRRHRVAWTNPDKQTIWLAVFFT